MRRLASSAFALAAALLLAACGGGGHTAQTTTTSTLTRTSPARGERTRKPPAAPRLLIVSSLPLSGPAASQGQAVKLGIELAWNQWHRRAGGFRIDYESLGDAAHEDAWTGSLVVANAQYAMSKADTILYIGELASGATQESMPFLSAAGIAQVSPGSPLSVNINPNPSGAGGGRPPAGSWPLRLAPSNAYQAKVIVQALKQVQGCTRIVVLHGGTDADGADLAGRLGQDIPQQSLPQHGRMDLIPGPPSAGGARAFGRYLASLRPQGANCAVYAGTLAGGAGTLIQRLHLALVSPAKVLVSSGACTSALGDPALGGVPPSMYPFVECTAPGPPLGASAAGQQFLQAYRKAYRSSPDPLAAFGYAAMEQGLRTINQLGSSASSRDEVLGALQRMPVTSSPIGPYAFDTEGGTTSTTYGLYQLGPGGGLELRTLPAS